MCGIAGAWSARKSHGSIAVSNMIAAIRHRGPNAEGLLTDDCGAILGHCRLSILDVSSSGAQPMESICGRYAISYNGEIYNFRDLRRQLESNGVNSWRGHSDTEVLLSVISRFGLQEALRQVDGMFAFALLDRKRETLTFARDPFGEKPLYYGLWRGSLLFASELKALRQWPGFQPEIDQQALADYFRHNYIPAPASIYAGVSKLPAAHTLEVRLGDIEAADLPNPQSYWSPIEVAQSHIRERADDEVVDMDALKGQLSSLLGRSVSNRLESDVPLGALLSGGVDSSLVTAIMSRKSSARVQTFSIGMDEPGYNEAGHARAVAEHLGTDHTELVLQSRDVLDVVPSIASIYDEPFADSSQVPTYLVSKMARAHVTVALSGDGGDELFGGYNRYFHAPRVLGALERVPYSVRRILAAALTSASPGQITRAVSALGALAPSELAAGRAGEKIHKLGRTLRASNAEEFLDQLLATSDDTTGVLLGSTPPMLLGQRAMQMMPSISDFVDSAMLTDTLNYLPDDVLTKVDRASMAVSLELRTPFLNRDLFEFAWSLPLKAKATQSQGKILLRELLYEHVPRKLIDRPKAGFAIPVGRWLRGPLRDWAESLLSEQALGMSGLIDPKFVRQRWAEHVSGGRDHEALIWALLMFQGWYAQACIDNE